MKFCKTNIKDVYVIEPETYTDERGKFSRIYCRKEFQSINVDKNFVQVNHSFTLKKGTIRGLHLQKYPREEAKLVKCIYGKVFDVVVDLRHDSATYLKWVSAELSKENMKMIYIPEGCAHGFQTLEDNSEMIYLHSEYYSPEHESRIYYNDEQIGIEWPLEVTKISVKDSAGTIALENLGAS
jgi:dTDP-4-dehydrorhamnose 3,5-epimerase